MVWSHHDSNLSIIFCAEQDLVEYGSTSFSFHASFFPFVKLMRPQPILKHIHMNQCEQALLPCVFTEVTHHQPLTGLRTRICKPSTELVDAISSHTCDLCSTLTWIECETTNITDGLVGCPSVVTRDDAARARAITHSCWSNHKYVKVSAHRPNPLLASYSPVRSIVWS